MDIYVYIEDPDELHEQENNYPLAPEKLNISGSMLSKYCSDMEDKYGIKVGGVNKLVTNLGNKSRYVLYYKNLQLCLSLRMKLAGVHSISEFKKSDWLKKYIDFNNDNRKNAVNCLEKELS